MAENVAEGVKAMDISDPQKKSQKKSKAKSKESGDGKAALPMEMQPPPAFIAQRLELWDKLKKERDEWIAAQERVDIKITLPDGAVKEGKAWETTPYSVAASISQGLADSTVVAKVNGDLWDLDRPLEKDAALQLLKYDDPEGQYVFWHSTAHMLGEAMERIYGGHLCYGPPIENGFYYDMFLDEKQVSSNDFGNLETIVKSIVKEKQPF